MDVLYSMKTLITLLILFLFCSVKAQNLFTVNGSVLTVSYSQGGVELMPEEYMPHPLSNTTLFVVQYYGVTEKSKIITSFTSDEHGAYEIKLPPGKYGFVLNKKGLGGGVYLPGMNVPEDTTDVKEILFTGVDQQDYWTLSTAGPFEVIDSDLDNIEITHYSISICYMCP